jgi:hypothetical protein
MPDAYTLDDLLSFLEHAGERGLMPAATAQAFAVATRNVFAVLDDAERGALPLHDLDAVVRRFTNKRARDFSPDSLKEYGRRVRRAVELYLRWKDDPANFAVKTRATTPRRRDRPNGRSAGAPAEQAAAPIANTEAAAAGVGAPIASDSGTYQTSLPVRPGHVVTVANIPLDLTGAEAERLAKFIRLLAQD